MFYHREELSTLRIIPPSLVNTFERFKPGYKPLPVINLRLEPRHSAHPTRHRCTVDQHGEPARVCAWCTQEVYTRHITRVVYTRHITRVGYIRRYLPTTQGIPGGTYPPHRYTTGCTSLTMVGIPQGVHPSPWWVYLRGCYTYPGIPPWVLHLPGYTPRCVASLCGYTPRCVASLCGYTSGCYSRVWESYSRVWESYSRYSLFIRGLSPVSHLFYALFLTCFYTVLCTFRHLSEPF